MPTATSVAIAAATASATAAAAVLDTNVVLDWLVFADARVAQVAEAARDGRLRWVACARMRDELAAVLGRPQLARWSPDVARVLRQFDTLAERWPDPPSATPPGHPLRCSDTDDQVFVDLALAARTRWLLTHDRALLRLARPAAARGLVVRPPQGWALD